MNEDRIVAIATRLRELAGQDTPADETADVVFREFEIDDYWEWVAAVRLAELLH